MNLNTIQENPDRMPFVRFEMVAVEDIVASQREGHYIAKDVEMVNVTPPYSKDIVKFKASNWLAQLKVDVDNGRMPADWAEKFRHMYELWKQGQEMPLEGTPIKGWGVISPAQQETLIRMHVLTVEQLAAITSEGTNRIGMGGIEMKNKAEAWLGTLKKAGRPTMEIASLRKENAQLKVNQELLESKIEELTQYNKSERKFEVNSIDLSDILD